MNINLNPYSPTKQSRTNTISRHSSASDHSRSVNDKSSSCDQDTVTISVWSGREKVYAGGTEAMEEVLPVSETVNTTGTMLPENSNLYYLGEMIKRYKNTIEDYYAKRNEENKRFADPQKHIWKKYWDRDYKYYEKGLTESERDWGWEQEMAAYNGREVSLSPHDPAIIKAFGGPTNGSSSPMDAPLNARQSMNEALNQIFKENGIVIPDGVDLRLTVDPYDHYIKASGVDEKLAEKIEAALNRGENGERLYSHIMFSRPGHYAIVEDPPQFSIGNPWKTSLFIAVKASTGYDIRELERRDGEIFTPDGQNLWDQIKDEYKSEEHYYAYQNVAWYGWDYADDEDRTIGYKDGSLYDIDTNYGFGPGQTAWIDSRREQNEKDKAEYMRERAETLRREESMPNRYERAFVDVEKLGGGKMNWAADGSYGDLFPNGALEQGGQTSLFDYIGGGTTGAIRDEMLKDGIGAPELITSMLNERMTNAVRSGTGALASEMFGIPGTTVRRRGMNLRA